MKTHRSKLAFATAVAFLSASAPVASQSQRPPRPSLSDLATAMEVPESALKSCLPPRQSGGSRQQGRPPKPDAGKIAACLKKAGHDVSSEKVEETFRAMNSRKPRD